MAIMASNLFVKLSSFGPAFLSHFPWWIARTTSSPTSNSTTTILSAVDETLALSWRDYYSLVYAMCSVNNIILIDNPSIRHILPWENKVDKKIRSLYAFCLWLDLDSAWYKG
ncbi:hypothetical protein GQ457_06G006460 [Hibiscus cannabinus]